MQIDGGWFVHGTSTSYRIRSTVMQKPSHLHLGFTLVFAVNVTLVSTVNKKEKREEGDGRRRKK